MVDAQTCYDICRDNGLYSNSLRKAVNSLHGALAHTKVSKAVNVRNTVKISKF